MKRLSKYIVSRIVVWWGVSSVGIVLIFLTTQLARIAPIFAGADLRAGELFAALGLLCVPTLAWSLTPAFVVAVFATCGRLAADGELIAIDSTGIARRRLLVGPIVLAVIGTGLSSFLWLVIGPRCLAELRDIGVELAGRTMVSELKRESFFEPTPGVVVFVERIELNGDFGGVFIEDARPGRRPVQVAARTANLRFDELTRSLCIGVEEGSAFLEPRSANEQPVALSFRYFTLAIPLAGEINKQLDFIPSTLGTLTGQLLEPPPNGVALGKWRYAFWRRLAGPAAFISLALVAIQLALGGLIIRQSVGATAATLLFLLYHLLGRYLEMPGTTGRIAPWFAALAPSFAVLTLGMLFTFVARLRWK